MNNLYFCCFFFDFIPTFFNKQQLSWNWSPAFCRQAVMTNDYAEHASISNDFWWWTNFVGNFGNQVLTKKWRLPVNISSLGVHHIVLLGKTFSEDSVYCNVVSNHNSVSYGSIHFVIWDLGSWCIVQTNFETCWAPFNERNLSVLFDPLYGGICNLGLDGPSVISQENNKKRRVSQIDTNLEKLQGNGHVLIFYYIKVRILHQEIWRL